MPKPATVEDEEPSPVSPIDEQSTFQTYASHPTTTVENPLASPSITCKSEKPSPTSVNELQGRFEELLINHPRYSAGSVPPPCCPASKREVPSMFQHQEPSKTNTSSTEIPVTRGAAARDKWFAELASVSHDRQNALRNNTGAPTPSSFSVFSVYCNNCSSAIPDEHYHCSTCDDGDFDLCQYCVDNGVLCGGDDHWMIKRFVKNGKVINSTTETIAPKPAASESKTTLVQPEEEEENTRTCNSCIQGEP